MESAWTTYRSVILVHEVIWLCHGFIKCGSARPKLLEVEELFQWVSWDVFEMGHWPRLSVESHQGVPGDAIVVMVTMGDDVLSGIARNKEGEF